MTIEKIQFTHAAYVEWLKSTSRGRPESIGKILLDHCFRNNQTALKTMEELGWIFFTEDCWTQAGEMILNNEKIVIN